MPENLEKTLETHSGLAARLLDIFIIANLAFLALDVFIAHSVNAFDHPRNGFRSTSHWRARATWVHYIHKKKNDGNIGAGSALDGAPFVSVLPECFFI